jgi:hypothetical protein
MPVPPALGRVVSDVAWENGDSVLVGTDQGVQRYSLRSRTIDRLVSVAPLPDGLPYPDAIESDGVTVVTTSSLSMGGYAMRLADRKRLSALRVRLLPLDVAVRGQRQCLLAFPLSAETDEAVWCGVTGQAWSKYKPAHRLGSGQQIFRYSTERLGGAVALAEDGSLYVITSAEPGLFHYAPDGRLIEKSGQSFDELVLTNMPELRKRFASDVDGRYRLLLGTQPILEDLVLTPRGPAILVRIAEKERVHWELWWPRADGRAVSPTRLGIDRAGPFGHLKCDARGTAIACVGSFPDKKQAADFHISELVPYLWIFELPK